MSFTAFVSDLGFEINDLCGGGATFCGGCRHLTIRVVQTEQRAVGSVQTERDLRGVVTERVRQFPYVSGDRIEQERLFVSATRQSQVVPVAVRQRGKTLVGFL